MAKQNDRAFDYKSKAAALDDIMARLQDPDIQIDEATKLHAEGMNLVKELEAYLQQAENTVNVHKASK